MLCGGGSSSGNVIRRCLDDRRNSKCDAGIIRMMAPEKRERSPRRIDASHCSKFNGVVEKAAPPNVMIIDWPTIMTSMIMLKKRFLWIPSKTFNLLSNRRQLISLKNCNHTNVLKMTVPSSGPLHPVSCGPAKLSVTRTASCRMDCPKIIVHIPSVTIGASFGTGARSSNARVGGSVARARAPSVSWIRFTHKSWTAVMEGVSSELAMAVINVMPTAVTLTVN